MSNLYDDDEETNLVKDLRRQLKEQTKAREEAERTASDLKGTVRKRTLEEVLTSKGVNPKVAAFIPSDVDGDEAVAKWLDDYAEVFGVKSASPAVEDGDLAAMQDVQSATATGGASTPSRIASDDQYMNEATTPAEWMERAKALKAGQVLDPNS